MRPRDVAGFESAVASGAVRPVPATPPPLLPGRTAASTFNRFLLHGAGIVAAILIAIEIVPRLGLPLVAESLLTLAIGLAGLWAILRALGRVGDRKLEEIAHGYTTLEIQFGGFWFGEGRRWPQFGHRAPWDYSGLWLLTGTGEVISAPDPAIEPPGLYPSPNRPGATELWSGVVWTGIYRGAAPS